MCYCQDVCDCVQCLVTNLKMEDERENREFAKRTIILDQYMQLICYLSTRMPNALKFCNHCLMWLARLNFGPSQDHFETL